MEQLKERLGEGGKDWLPLASITPDGDFSLYTGEESTWFRKTWRLIYFAPGPGDQ